MMFTSDKKRWRIRQSAMGEVAGILRVFIIAILNLQLFRDKSAWYGLAAVDLP